MVAPFARALAEKISVYGAEVVCGPLSGGAFLAEIMAASLAIDFAFADRIVSDRRGLFPVDYRIAAAMRQAVGGKRVAVVDDAISAGSAVLGTMRDLGNLGASVVALGALMLVGDRPLELAREYRLPLESLLRLPNRIWLPAECPMCEQGAALQSSS